MLEIFHVMMVPFISTHTAREHSDSSVSPRAPTMMTESDMVATPHSNNGSSSNRIRPTRTDAITATRGDGRVRPTRDHTDTITTTTSGDSESAGVRVLHSNHLLSYQELNEEEEEDSQVVFATDSPPSPPFLGRGSGGGGAGGGARAACVGGGGSSSSSRLLSKETTCIPERCVVVVIPLSDIFMRELCALGLGMNSGPVLQ